ncbi:Uncharacterised protein [Streptococcus pneumoniae]|nr:Uncharacterised protein [Streptococcus pneumoniae]
MAQLLTSQKENEKAIQTMNEKLLFAEANELLQHPTEIHAGILISKVFTNRSMQEIAKLSKEKVAEIRRVLAVAGKQL